MKFLIALTLLLLTGHLQAQISICPDVEGAIPHTLLSNYKNSCIVGYNQTKFDAVTVPISQNTSQGADKELTVEGKVIDIIYGIENSANITVLEVQRNYEQALKKSGLEIIYSAFGKKSVMLNNSSIPVKYESVGSPKYLMSFEHLKHNDFRLVFNYLSRNQDGELAYFVAQGNKDGKDYTLVLYINYCKGNSAIINNKIFVHAKIIEAEKMDTDQVSVASIEDKIKNEGKEIFHNILFDLGSDKLTSESYPVIGILAEYLNSKKDKKYYIVGHTDNTGSLEANQTLSEKRAKAVLSALTTKYNVNASQISAHGVGQLSPLSINTTEKGRALNRRVEIVMK